MHRKLSKVGVLFALFVTLLSGCAQRIQHSPLSLEQYNAIEFSDSGGTDRWWGDSAPPGLEDSLRKHAVILKQRFPSAVTSHVDNVTNPPRYDSLIISGGGADGAFGAGILVGWTKSGLRPQFEVVTGTSTGAVIAPFAFLGEEYDDKLYEIYSNLTRAKVYESRLLNAVFGGSSIADTQSLRSQIERHVTLDLIKKIAVEHRKARSLFVVTTHFDSMRPMIWDIGSIAAQENNQAVLLIRKVILASASIPVLFPPVKFERKIEGKIYTELHIDGGVTRNAFSYPAKITMADIERIQGLHFNRNVYVIQNSNSKLSYEPAPTDLAGIASRSTLGLLQNKINSDIEQIYYLSKRDGIHFNMIEIPDHFKADKAIEFDTTYINELLQLGIELGQKGSFWHSTPPSER